MLTTGQKNEFSSLQVELIDLNISAYFYLRKINRFAYLMQKTTRHYVIEELTALRYMENGVILHLTNLDDDSSKYSFREASKELHKTAKDQAALTKLRKRLNSYRQSVNSLKVQHRNTRIAHANFEKDLRIDEFLNFDVIFKPLIVEANLIGDIILGTNLHYKFKLGSIEGILDFRKLVETGSIDLNREKGFT